MGATALPEDGGGAQAASRGRERARNRHHVAAVASSTVTPTVMSRGRSGKVALGPVWCALADCCVSVEPQSAWPSRASVRLSARWAACVSGSFAAGEAWCSLASTRASVRRAWSAGRETGWMSRSWLGAWAWAPPSPGIRETPLFVLARPLYRP